MRNFTAFLAMVWFAFAVPLAAADETGSMKDKTPAPPSPNWDIAFGGYMASDYNFRGISQSNRWPSGSAYSELRYNPWPNLQLYYGNAIENVDYPNRAAGEVDSYGGIRPTFDKLTLDFGAWYYWYPGGRRYDGSGPEGPNPNCTNGFKLPGGCNVLEADVSYWEAYTKATYAVNDKLTVGGNVFYSPSWWSEDAYGTWASGNFKVILPTDFLPKDISFLPKDIGWFLLAEAGHYWFGQTKPFYGSVDLPGYTAWNAGIAFTWKVFTLDLRYWDTDLTKAECNILMSDHTATFSPDNVTRDNPSGLGSSWCGSSFVAKVSVDMTVNTNLK
jgi:uncharacterized protein (TIGR02001 family)